MKKKETVSEFEKSYCIPVPSESASKQLWLLPRVSQKNGVQ